MNIFKLLNLNEEKNKTLPLNEFYRCKLVSGKPTNGFVQVGGGDNFVTDH